MADSVFSAYSSCIHSFGDLLEATEHIPIYYRDQINVELVRGFLERFQLWAGNLGAGHSGRKYELSLDYRLREASSLRSAVIGLLESLANYLYQLIQLLSGERLAFEQQEAFLEDASQVSSGSAERSDSLHHSSSGSSSTDDSEVIAFRAELQAKFAAPTMIISSDRKPQDIHESPKSIQREVPYLIESTDLLLDRLYNLPIRRPAPMDRFIRHDNTSLFNKYVAPFDIDYVRSLFPNIDENIVALSRLGAMNTQRRRILEYRERHHDRLKGKSTSVDDTIKVPLAPTTLVVEYKPSPTITGSRPSDHTETYQTKATTFEPSAERPSLLPPSPSPARSIVSQVTSRMAKNIPVEIPPQPTEVSEGHGYICPYCFVLTHNLSQEKWNEHVMRDLQPYVCTYTECRLGEHFFNHKDDWYAHESRYHRCSWSCNVPEHGIYTSDDEFVGHLRAEHLLDINLKMLDEAGEAFRKAPRERAGTCHLCRQDVDNLKTHVARHLERVALFILPPSSNDQDSDLNSGDLNSQRAALRPRSREDFFSSSGEVPLEAEAQTGNDEDPDKIALAPPIKDEYSNMEQAIVVPESFEWNPDMYTDKFSEARKGNGPEAPTSLRKREHSSALLFPESEISLVPDSSQEYKLQPEKPRRMMTYADYSVAWICTLDMEMLAAYAMLDEEHLQLKAPPDDFNRYVLGTIKGHEVVIVHPPSVMYDPFSMAPAVALVLRTFPRISTFLLVGIGGGVPQVGHDIRLGDVVVSVPTSEFPAVVQYDFGKSFTSRRLVTKDYFYRPDQRTLGAVMSLRSAPVQNSIQLFIEDALKRHDLAQHGFEYPGSSNDTLYSTTCEHSDGLKPCESCGPPKVVMRPARTSTEPLIHYGIIGSSDRVMKNSRTRDQVAGKNGIICFEMEATGLIGIRPCLVIKGICDYCDEYNTKDFQEYAALAAAGYAKCLLSVLPKEQALQEHPSRSWARKERSEHREVMMQALNFDEADSRRATIKRSHHQTSRWILEHPDYILWLVEAQHEENHRILWLKGKPGSGKSTIMKFLAEHSKSQKKIGDNTLIVSFFFNARGSHLERSMDGMYRSLLFQLLSQVTDLQFLLDTLTADVKLAEFNTATLVNLLEQAVSQLGRRQVLCFVDALDECPEDQVRELLEVFEQLSSTSSAEKAQFRVCLSSRHYPRITAINAINLLLDIESGHFKDLNAFIASELKIGKSRQAQSIHNTVLHKSNGNFLWVVLVIRQLRKEFDRGRLHEMRRLLDQVPTEMNDMFNAMLLRDETNTPELILCLQWVLHATMPLAREELYCVLLSESNGSYSKPDSEDYDALIMDNYILSCSKGLAEVVPGENPTVQLIHETVRGYLLENKTLQGLTRFAPVMQPNVAHEVLRDCCEKQCEAIFQFYDEPHLPSRTNLCQSFPFLEYAVREILYHAEQAQTHGSPQIAFLRQFNWSNWVFLWNILEENPLQQMQAIGSNIRTADVMMLLMKSDVPMLRQVWAESAAKE